MRSQVIRRSLPWLQRIVVLVAVLFIVLLLRSHWGQLRAYPWQILPSWFAAASTLLAITWLVEIEIWRRIIGQMGGNIPRPQALRIWFLTAVVRYIPGNIWQTLSLALYCRRWKIRAETTIASLIVYQVVILIAAIPIGVAYVMFGSHRGLDSLLGVSLSPAAQWAITLASILAIVLLMGNRKLLFRLVDWLLTRVHRPPLEIDLPVGFLTAILLWALFDWILWGCTFAVFTYALGAIAPGQRLELLPALVTSYPVAYVAGFVSLLAPSGLGVREGAFMLLLTPQLDAAVVAVVAIAMRAWTTVGEFIAAGIAAATGPVGYTEAIESAGAARLDAPVDAAGTRQAS